MDHNNGYFRVPLHMCMVSRKYLGVFWKGVYYVLTVLRKSSPAIYHSITEAVNTYVRSLGIPILGWIKGMLGMTEQCLMMRAMVVVSIINK